MLKIEKINAIAELNRFGWAFTPSGPDEIKCVCPVHEDKIASLSLNVVKNVWICHASHCKASGDIISLLAYIGNVERKTIIADLQERYPGLSSVKTIKPDRVENWHNAIWNSGPLLQELYKRGLTDEDIREHKLGYSIKEQRIMIPVFDKEGRVINVRKYLPGAPGPDKTRNVSGYNSRAIYLIDQLKFPTVWICGGELKAIVAKRFINPSGAGAISFTGAEGAWHESLNKELKDKIIFICMDVDAGGREGARRLAAQINPHVKTVFIVDLSSKLDITKYPKGDLNDLVGQEKATVDDFVFLAKTATQYIPPYYKEQDDNEIEAIKCSLIEARRSESVGKKIETSFVVNMLDTENYLVPKDIKISCTRDSSCCPNCIVNSKPIDEKTGLVDVMILPLNQEFLGLIATNQRKENIHRSLLDALGIPSCKSARFTIDTYYNVADVRLGTELDLESNSGKTDINQPAYIVGFTEDQIELNIPYVGICRNFPDPAKGSSTLLIYKLSRKEDSLSSFSLSKDDFKLLKIFQTT